MSVFGDIMTPYWFGFKALLLAVIVILVAGYISYLKIEITSYQAQVKRVEKDLKDCQEHAKDLVVQNQQQAENLERIQTYYANKKCLDLRPGELTEDDFKFK